VFPLRRVVRCGRMHSPVKKKRPPVVGGLRGEPERPPMGQRESEGCIVAWKAGNGAVPDSLERRRPVLA